MADYTEIKGNRIQYLDSDPTLTSATEGQVWYNTATGTLKGLTQIKAWSSGGNLPTATYGMYGAGIQTAALGSGGYSTGSGYKNATYEYNGFSWSSGGNLGGSTAYGAGFGTQTAAIAAGGFPGPGTPTFEYDGSAWTAGGALSTGRINLSGFGILTSGAVAGGNAPGGPPRLSNTEEYDGTSWTSGGGLNTARGDLGVAGTLTAGLAFGGNTNTPSFTNTTEHYDGSSWTTVSGTLNTTRSILHASSGTQTAALGFGGFTPSVTGATEEYDGSNWITSSASLATARGRNKSATNAPKNASLSIGGYNGTTSVAATEEYFSDIANYDPSSTSAWASGGNLPSTAPETVGTGEKNAALTIGAENGLPTGVVLEYDGSAWSSGGSLNTARYGGGASGTQTSGLYFTGRPVPGFSTATEGYDGSSWTSLNPVNSQGFIVNGFGTQNAAVLAGGRPSTPGVASNRTEDWDGTSWTNGNTMSLARAAGGTAGTQTAGMIVGGSSDSFTYYNNTEHYDGTSWTSVPGTLSLGRRVQRGQVGSQSSSLAFGGYNGSPSTQNAYATSEEYNGTTWALTPSMANKRSSHGGTGANSSDGLAIGGYNGSSQIASTEEFTGGSPASPTGAAASTLTTS